MPKRFPIVTLLVSALLLGGGCGSPEEPSGRHTPRGVTGPPAPEPGVVRGEVVDMGCYLRQGAHGSAHQPCAAESLKQGSPAGLLGETGELFLLIPEAGGASKVDFSHYAARLCDVHGDLVRRAGIRGILLKAIEVVEPPAPAP
jgi:hypothetical protein